MSKHLLMLELNRGASGVEYLEAAKRLGYTVTLVTFNPGYYAKIEKQLGTSLIHYLDNMLTLDTHHDIAGMLDKIEKYHQVFPVDGVLGQYDLEIYQSALVAERLGLPGVSPKAVEVCRSKYLTRQALYDSGIPVPRFKLVETAEEAQDFAKEIGYPCVLKPVDGQGSDNVLLISSPEDFAEPFLWHKNHPVYFRGVKRFPKLLVEEYLQGSLISVETVSEGDRAHVLGITDRTLGEPPFFVAHRASFPGLITDGQAAIDMAKQSLHAVGYTFGPAHTEILMTKDGPRIVEINPRIAGSTISQMFNWSKEYSVHEQILKLTVGLPASFAGENIGVGSYLRIFADKSGVFERLEGIDEAFRVPGMKSISVEQAYGEIVTNHPKSIIDGLVLLTAFAKSREEVNQALAHAVSKLKVKIKEPVQEAK